MPDVRELELAKELRSLLERVAGDWVIDKAHVDGSSVPLDRVGLGSHEGRYRAWIRSTDSDRAIVLNCVSESQPMGDDLLLIRRLVTVFSHDLRVVGDEYSAKEIWIALSQTRFLRAASRLSSISTEPLLKRIRIFEAAAKQTYEGSPFVGSVVMPHHLKTFQTHAGDRFRPFKQPMPFHQALLREKWLRPFLADGEFALVTVSFRGMARGFTDASLPWGDSVQTAPAMQLEGLFGYIRPGTSVLSATPSGDILFALPSGLTFVNSKGQWRYQNWSPLEQILHRHCVGSAVGDVMRLVRGASYRHQGALIVILRDDANVAELLPDHSLPGRAAKALRSTMKGTRLDDPVGTKLANVASRIDGAIVLDSMGNVIDVASMVTDPNHDLLARAGLRGLKRFPGARTTAAWNASMSGLAVKVSDDGPVDVFENGKLVFHSD